MPLSIRLDSPPSIHSTCIVGDIVAGSVTLTSSQDEAVGSVQITFFGRAKTKIHRSNGQSSTTYKGRADFFRYTETLYSGKFTLRAGEYTWPFSFTFPDATLHNTQHTEWKASGGFHSQPGHPLPPSFSASHHGFTGNYESFIEYKLEVSLTRPPESYLIYSRGLQADTRLSYSPTREVENPEPEFSTQVRRLTHASLLLLPENEGRSLTFKEKTRSIFKSSDLPRSCFAIAADIPRVVWSVQKIPIFIGLEHMLETSTAPQTPVIKLRSFALKIMATTSVRAPRHLSFTGEVTDTTTDKVYLENSGILSIPITKRMDLRDYFSNRVGKVLDPSFSTYNICRSYRLELRLTVQCIDKEFSVDYTPQSIVVLPQMCIRGEVLAPRSSQKLEMLAHERETQQPDETGGAGAGPADEPLPLYTPHDPENGILADAEVTKMGAEEMTAKKSSQPVT